jgi:hypothetical protein
MYSFSIFIYLIKVFFYKLFFYKNLLLIKGVLHKYNEITQSAPAEVSNDAQLLSFFVYASFQDSEECKYFFY